MEESRTGAACGRDLDYVTVFEVAIALMIAALLLALALSPPGWLVAGGLGMASLGLLVGIPAAVLYHWHLHAVLKPRGQLPRHWIWNPTSLHDRLTTDDRRRINPSLYTGASGFVACVAGLILAVTGLLRAL